MRLQQWAKKHGVTYRTAWEHFRCGKIKNAFQLETGTIVIPEEITTHKVECVITYARVSSSENKDNLERQSKRLLDFCNAKGWKTSFNISEIGSGLNDKRQKLNKILEEGKATKLVVEHKDRLSRFGVAYIEILCKKIDCDLVILNPVDNNRDDLMQDFVSVVTSFCARLYGLRRSRRKTEKLIAGLKNEKE